MCALIIKSRSRITYIILIFISLNIFNSFKEVVKITTYVEKWKNIYEKDLKVILFILFCVNGK